MTRSWMAASVMTPLPLSASALPASNCGLMRAMILPPGFNKAAAAVNTIIHEAGRLVGYNTDWLGAVQALERERALAGARAVVLGAGPRPSRVKMDERQAKVREARRLAAASGREAE